MKVVLKILTGALIFLFLLVLSLITTVNWTPYQEMEYYRETMAELENLQFESSDEDFMLAGWASANITPKEPVPLVAYRPRGNYEFVQDSSFVKAIVFGKGDLQIALLNYELLIVHPQLAETIKKAISKKGLPIYQVYFTATHTHSGMGGTIPGLIGQVAMGGWDKSVVTLLEEKTLEALEEALSTMDTVSLSYKKVNAGTYVTNRLVAGDPVDPYLRQLNFENRSGKTCSFITYSAHATCLSSRFMGLSGDYPHYLTQLLQDKTDLAVFASGAVGSHRPVAPGNDVAGIKKYAYKLDSLLQKDPSPDSILMNTQLKAARLPLKLRSPHYRISDNLRLRPWVFNWVFGDNPAHFDIIRLGNTLLLSSSGEVSGVFYEGWESFAEMHGYNLMVTTFNGGYVGYITPDKYYQEDFYEVRDMNLYGPYNGDYFNEVIFGLIEKAVK